MNIRPGTLSTAISFDSEHKAETVVLELGGHNVHITAYTPNYSTINIFRQDDETDSTVVYSSRIMDSVYENMKDLVGNTTRDN